MPNNMNATVSHLIVCKLSGVLQVHLLFPQWCVAGGKCQTAQCVPSRAPLLDDRHDVVFDGASQGHTCRAHANIRAAVNDTLWSTLSTKLSQHTLSTYNIIFELRSFVCCHFCSEAFSKSLNMAQLSRQFVDPPL